jgi:flagellar biosynthesis/type III secretory pathway chaperone
MLKGNDSQKIYYQRVLTIWEEFCTLHQALYNYTCEEYLTLLESDVDKLEEMLPLKEEIINKVSELEQERSELIHEINQRNIFSQPILKSTDLLNVFGELEQLSPIRVLEKLNSLLIETIKNIQEQNKKNQTFLNKAMLSLGEIKQGFSGKKNYITYGADGLARTLGR